MLDRNTVGLIIRNTENVKDKVVGISLRRRNQLMPDVVWDVPGKVIQSNARFGLTAVSRFVWIILGYQP
jgi:hypothetical protein